MNQVRAMMRSIALEMESDDVVRTHLGLRLAERNKAAEAALEYLHQLSRRSTHPIPKLMESELQQE